MSKQNPPLDRATQREILDAAAAGECGTSIAYRLGVPKSVVYRVIKRGTIYVPPVTAMRVTLVRPYKCPGCNRAVMLYPCVICRTLRVRDFGKAMSGE